MAYKDEALLVAHPDKTAYELLQLGLSEAKYNELVAANYTPEAVAVQPEVTAPVPQATPDPEPEKIKPVVAAPQRAKRAPKATPAVRMAAQPKLTPLRPGPVPNHNVPMATLVNRKTGKRTRMSRAIAEKVAKMDKGKYDVI